ncbi:hypothetical protein IC582_026021 [Cucumis melo]
MNLVKICKVLQVMRESGWQSLLDEASSFCNKHGILMLKMDDAFLFEGGKDEILKKSQIYIIIVQKLICLAQFYPRDFSTTKLLILEDQLQNYIIDVCSDNLFVGLTSIGDLSQKMVITAKDKVYPLVYRLLTLALIFPVTMATVERTFSAMSVIKTRLRNRIENQ